MRIAIQTLGTRGDVQPYVALAEGLINRGHDVQIAAPVQFASLVSDRNIAFAALPGEFLELMNTPEGKAAIAGNSGFSSGLKLLKYVRPLMRRLFDEEWSASKAFAPEAIVYHPKSISAPHIAEALNVPSMLASPLPGFTPTSAFPSPLLPFATMGPFNKVSHKLATSAANVLFGKEIQAWRYESLGLPRGAGMPPARTVYAYSKHVVPVPLDWDHNVLVSGYWFLDSPEWSPSAALE